jgi:hypothetical protein
MLGVSSAPQEAVKPPKAKSRSKKTEDKRTAKHETVVVDLIDDEPVVVAPSPRPQAPTTEILDHGQPKGFQAQHTEAMPALSTQPSIPKQSKSQSKRKGLQQEPTSYPHPQGYEPPPATPNVTTLIAAAAPRTSAGEHGG